MDRFVFTKRSAGGGKLTITVEGGKAALEVAFLNLSEMEPGDRFTIRCRKETKREYLEGIVGHPIERKERI
jgi:hypothetical protein